MQRLKRILINYRWPIKVISIIVALALAIFAQQFLKLKYEELFVNLVSSSISLLGFAVTAVTILISLQDRGLIAAIQKEEGKFWKTTLEVFFSSIKGLGLLALLVLIVGKQYPEFDLQLRWFSIDDFGQKAYFFAVTALFVYNVFQIIKLIYVLKRVALLAVVQARGNKGG